MGWKWKGRVDTRRQKVLVTGPFLALLLAQQGSEQLLHPSALQAACAPGDGASAASSREGTCTAQKHTSCDSTCFCHIGFCHFQSESHFDDTTLRCWQRDSASAASGFSTSVSKLYWPERCRCRKANWLKKFMATESALASMDKNFRISCSGKSQDQCGASRPSETH